MKYVYDDFNKSSYKLPSLMSVRPTARQPTIPFIDNTASVYSFL